MITSQPKFELERESGENGVPPVANKRENEGVWRTNMQAFLPPSEPKVGKKGIEAGRVIRVPMTEKNRREGILPGLAGMQ